MTATSIAPALAATEVPAWVTLGERAPGVAVCTVPLPDAVRAALQAFGVDRDAALVAVHARVVAGLSGDPEVVVGVVGAGLARAVRVDTATGSWRDVIAAAADALPAAAELDAADGGGAVDLTGAGVVPPGVRFTIGATETGLRLRYRVDALNVAAAERIAGYHVSALTALAADPSAAPQANSLVGAEEREFQLRGMRGPDRALPDVRLHRIVEEQAHRRPDAVAAACGEQRLTYAELNARANRVARSLITRGVSGEDVVAVACHRDLDWLVAVLAVFKAGATYLPVEPQFPPARIAAMLRRAECRLALTTPGARKQLDAADVAETVLTIDDALVASTNGTDLDVEVGPGHRAYIYFTSGSTGEPKGAMCEHGGMLNHVLAKIEDLGIAEGDAVAQVAPQCFDISLWQLVAALVAGGRTVIVPQEVVLDAERMLELVAREQIAVLQVVPSYLEVLMTEFERRPRALRALRAVSVTGEAVKHELAERWFALTSGIALVNAYGLTETSDDTNHEVMHDAPSGSRVPLGPPVRNVAVYVVDEALEPVPLGAPGEIVFSGVCVGRGYVNDPDRTAAAFTADPHEPGVRLYRSGDFGRWRPDGKLEFLGRRDTQLKIAGFRIEIGEIENTLLRAPGVRDACVVVATRAGGSRHLVGFYDADEELAIDGLHAHLAASLPHYMVPGELHHRHPLPLSGNGKVDRKVLTVLAGELVPAAAASEPGPTTPEQRRVAAAWAAALGTADQTFALDDDFFAIGGTSLSAVKVVIGLDRAVTLRQVTTHRTLRALAAQLEQRSEP